MNPLINKLFYDDGSVPVVPLYCVYIKHQEKINEKKEEFGEYGLISLCQGTDNAKI